MQPMNVIEAVTDPNPYPFYTSLVAQNPFYYDTSLKAWIATSVSVITEVLTSSACHVRPLGISVPPNLAGSTAGLIFSQLTRMTDGATHARLKPPIAAATALLTASALASSRRWAKQLPLTPTTLNEWMACLSLYVVADLLGIPAGQQEEIIGAVRQFAACLNPLSSPESVAKGQLAANDLFTFFRVHLLTRESDSNLWLGHLRQHLPDQEEIIAANAIGVLFQAYEAMAGLLGNALVTLVKHPLIYQALLEQPSLVPQFIQEVLRYDPPVQNTRRYLATDTVLGDQPLSVGEMVIIVLAAANRDSQANPTPQNFLFNRENRRHFTFGLGRHLCAGHQLACLITQAGLEQLIPSGLVSQLQTARIQYLPYVNLRIPVFYQ